MDRIYSEIELHDVKPVGEVKVKTDGGITYKVTLCHGCQTCWSFTDESCTKIVKVFPHFLSYEKLEDVSE